jgi:hypothetical protein
MAKGQRDEGVESLLQTINKKAVSNKSSDRKIIHVYEDLFVCMKWSKKHKYPSSTVGRAL